MTDHKNMITAVVDALQRANMHSHANRIREAQPGELWESLEAATTKANIADYRHSTPLSRKTWAICNAASLAVWYAQHGHTDSAAGQTKHALELAGVE